MQNNKNSIRNSKLQISMRPFQTIKEEGRDLKKSKSTDKNRKGLSRVDDYRENSKNDHTQDIQIFKSEQENHPMNSEMGYQQPLKLQQQHRNLITKIREMEADQIVIERQNIQLEKQMKQLRHQYEADRQKLNYYSRCLEDKEQCIRSQEKLLKKNKGNQVNQLAADLEFQKQKNKKYQEQITELQSLKAEQIADLQRLQKSLALKTDENNEIREKHRQCLIKYIPIEQERDYIGKKLMEISQQLNAKSNRIEALERDYEFVLNEKTIFEREAMLINQYKLELEQLRKQNKVMQPIIRELENKVKDLEFRKITLIQFHQEQLKKAEQKWANICEQVSRKHNEERENLKQSVNSEKSKCENMVEDYQKIIYELKNRLQKSHQQISKYSLDSKQLIQKISSLESDNQLLLSKISNSQVHQQWNNGDYRLNFIKLEDKLHLNQIQNEKNKDKIEIYERKIKHFQQQIQHSQIDKEKLIGRQVALTEQLQAYKTENQRLKQANGIFSQKIRKMQNSLAQQSQLEASLKQQVVRACELSQQKQLYKEKYERQVRKAEEFGEEVRKREGKREEEVRKLRECIELMKSEEQIRKQKLVIEQYISKKEDLSEKQLRLAVYGRIYGLLGVKTFESRGEQISEIQTLRHLEKSIQINFMERQRSPAAQPSENLQQKCLEYEHLIIQMEEAHTQQLILVKQDYDIVYGKYLKYRDIVVKHNLSQNKKRKN